MALEFQKISDQIYRMGAMIENLDFDQRENLRIAKERFWGANDMDLIKRRIELVRQSSFSGYRGAAALDEPYTEAINKTISVIIVNRCGIRSDRYSIAKPPGL